MTPGSFTIYEKGLPASSVYTFSVPSNRVPDIGDVPSSAMRAAERAHCVTFMSESGDLWLIKDRHYTGVLPRLLCSSTDEAPLTPMPVAGKVIAEIRRRFNHGYGLQFRGDIIRDVGLLLQALDAGRPQPDPSGPAAIVPFPNMAA